MMEDEEIIDATGITENTKEKQEGILTPEEAENLFEEELENEYK